MKMKFYLESAEDLEPYDDLKTNRLMRNYWQKIEKETDLKTEDLLTCLTTVELKGIIKQCSGDRYKKV